MVPVLQFEMIVECGWFGAILVFYCFKLFIFGVLFFHAAFERMVVVGGAEGCESDLSVTTPSAAFGGPAGKRLTGVGVSRYVTSL
jgi:hypothetical protein